MSTLNINSDIINTAVAVLGLDDIINDTMSKFKARSFIPTCVAHIREITGQSFEIWLNPRKSTIKHDVWSLLKNGYVVDELTTKDLAVKLSDIIEKHFEESDK